MALIQVEENPGSLTLSLEQDRLHVAVPTVGPVIDVDIWDDSVAALDAGDEAARWLSSALDQSCRLVYMPDSTQRLVDPVYAGQQETVSFADGFPVLLLSQGALDALGDKLGRTVPSNRFRPNIVIDGCEPHAEDKWQRIRIGVMEFDVAKPCARCVMPSIEQSSAEKDKDILRTLADYRRWADAEGVRQIFFGQNLLYRGEGRISIGDELEVIS